MPGTVENQLVLVWKMCGSVFLGPGHGSCTSRPKGTECTNLADNIFNFPKSLG